MIKLIKVTKTNMNLEQELRENAAIVQTTAYSMSLQELVAMYKDGELMLHPEFQRFFRWKIEQKSRFIESLLLGIPIPPIFVVERKDAKWDVIDGLQRISTILELMEELENEDGNQCNPLVLTRTHYLPSLEQHSWSGADASFALPDSVKIKLKRARLDLNIVKEASDRHVQHEIFLRLNTGGSQATEQEVRNCILVMENPGFFQ